MENKIRVLPLTATERQVLDWALSAALDFQQEQLEPGNLEPGEEPISLLDDLLYRIGPMMTDMRPDQYNIHGEMTREHRDWKRHMRGAQGLQKKLISLNKKE